MPQEIGPEAERRIVLKHFALTELELNKLRALPPDEAAWRVEHEHRVGMKWMELRRKFILSDVLPGPKHQRQSGTGTPVQLHRSSFNPLSQEGLG